MIRAARRAAQPAARRPKRLASPLLVPKLVLFLLLGSVATETQPRSVHAQDTAIPTPTEFFGHEMGADRQLARWDRLVEYYDLIGERSDRVDVRHVGESTLGHPFLVIFVSSPENLANLDEIQAMNATLQDPRGASEQEIEAAIENGKTIVVQSYGLHSTEVAGSQAAADILYHMATRTDSEMMRILEETVAIQIPNFNPDGNFIIMSRRDDGETSRVPEASPMRIVLR